MLLKAIEVDPMRKKLVFSAKEAQAEQRFRRIQELRVGEVMTGTVINIVEFGAFIDLGGVDGLLHNSEYDYCNTPNNLAEFLDLGQEINVEVKEIDIERERISLSRKALMPNPWITVLKHYLVGDLVEGEITGVVDFGVFVRLPEGVEGLIHKSELADISHQEAMTHFEPGQMVLVKILKIEPERERISLSLDQVTNEDRTDWSGHDQPKSEVALEADIQLDSRER
jgi:small subunit ribosomal protein S1